MSLRRGLTSWVVRAGGVTLAYRWNMGLREASHTFSLIRGRRVIVACGPLIVEW